MEQEVGEMKSGGKSFKVTGRRNTFWTVESSGENRRWNTKRSLNDQILPTGDGNGHTDRINNLRRSGPGDLAAHYRHN